MNPVIRKIAEYVLGNNDRVKIVESLYVINFHNLLNKAYLILTDSRGIQEEDPPLGNLFLVMLVTTKRLEGVNAGTLKHIGTDEENIYKQFKLLLTDIKVYNAISQAINPYGDGCASIRIASILEQNL